MAVVSPSQSRLESALPPQSLVGRVGLGTAVVFDGAGLVPLVAPDRPFLAVVEIALGFALMLGVNVRFLAATGLTLYSAVAAANVTAVIVSDRGTPLSSTVVDVVILSAIFVFLIEHDLDEDELW